MQEILQYFFNYCKLFIYIFLFLFLFIFYFFKLLGRHLQNLPARERKS